MANTQAAKCVQLLSVFALLSTFPPETQVVSAVSLDSRNHNKEFLVQKEGYDNWDANYLGQAIMSTDQDESMVQEAAAQIQKAYESTVLTKKIHSMKEELDLFSRTQDPDHFKAAIALRNELNEEGHPQKELIVNTKELFEAGFAFKNVAEYDHVVQMLSDVGNAQDNLNNN